jgi:hypothetical protein
MLVLLWLRAAARDPPFPRARKPPHRPAVDYLAGHAAQTGGALSLQHVEHGNGFGPLLRELRERRRATATSC